MTWGKDQGFQPNADALIRRASRLNGEVRFTAANQSLDAVNAAEIDRRLRCEREYLKGQVVFRLRKRDEAFVHWKAATTECDDQDESLEVRALYAYGKRAFDIGKYDEAHAAFSKLVAKFPHRSHVDDAYVYLARIARERGDRDTELGILSTVLNEHAGGDMVFELVWEVHEATFRAGEYRKFVDAIASLKLPDHDNEYFSQGRLEYFVGRAHQKLGAVDSALASFRRAWARYPFSFYGYLSHEVLVAAGETPVLEATSGHPAWMESRTWRYSAPNRLLRAGLADLAARAAYGLGRSTDELWMRAWALDATNNTPSVITLFDVGSLDCLGWWTVASARPDAYRVAQSVWGVGGVRV
ncbi:MAG: tetratricopeptide repeat protein [bacterium]